MAEMMTWSINPLAPERFEWNFSKVIFKGILVIDGWGISCDIALRWKSIVNIGSGNGLEQSGNKPLPVLMLIQIYCFGITG